MLKAIVSVLLCFGTVIGQKVYSNCSDGKPDPAFNIWPNRIASILLFPPTVTYHLLLQTEAMQAADPELQCQDFKVTPIFLNPSKAKLMVTSHYASKENVDHKGTIVFMNEPGRTYKLNVTYDPGMPPKNMPVYKECHHYLIKVSPNYQVNFKCTTTQGNMVWVLASATSLTAQDKKDIQAAVDALHLNDDGAMKFVDVKPCPRSGWF